MRNFLLITYIILILTGCSASILVSSPSTQREISLQAKQIDTVQMYLNELMKYAENGKVPGSSINVMKSTLEQVKEAYGEPDKIDQAGYGYYATYENLNLVFGYGKNGDIFDVRSYSGELKQITYEILDKTYGTPTEVRRLMDENIYVYRLDKGVEMKWVIPHSNSVVHHLSVFNSTKAVSSDPKEESEYRLKILGETDQLPEATWNNMIAWREQILEFSKGHNNVILNGPNKKMVALTFDDGPDDLVTPAVIRILNEYNVKGTFFFVGENVAEHPEVVKEAYDKGNLVLSHSYEHVELITLTKEQIQYQLDMANQTIKEVIGVEPALFRPPYGSTNEDVMEAANNKGMSAVIWSIDSLDWANKNDAFIASNILDNVRNGDIILMHSNFEHHETAIALPAIIEGLRDKGFEIVDLQTLLNLKAYQ